MDKEQEAIMEVRSCEAALCDPWRCDFCEYPCDCDERRKTEALENIMRILNISFIEADNFYERWV